MEPWEDRSDSSYRGELGFCTLRSKSSTEGLEFSLRALECCIPVPVWSQSDLGSSMWEFQPNPGGQRDTGCLGDMQRQEF